MTAKPIYRRRFLRLIGLTLGACALTCTGASLFTMTGEDRPADPLPIGYPELTLGQPSAARKILVGYASAAGSTGGVAQAVGETLAATGAAAAGSAVDVRPVTSVSALDGYHAVVLGSAIHGGKWLPAAVEFLQAHQERLRQVPTAFFLVGMMVANLSQENQTLVSQYLIAEREQVQPVAEGRFTGALFPRDYPFFTGFGMRFFLAYCGVGLRGGDYRDRAAVTAWAKEITPLLG